MKKIIASIYPAPFDTQLRHEINSSIFKDGDIYSYEEGKLSTIKNDPVGMFPERSFFLGLKELNVKPDKIDKWVFPKPKRKILINDYYLFFKNFCKAYLGTKEKFKSWFLKKVKFIKHHDLHIYNAIGSSNFKECFYISSDGGGDLGDNRNTSWGIYKNKKIFEKGKIFGTNSLSSFHAFVTEACGFRNENGKLSGLSSYGQIRKELYISFSELLKIKKNGIYFNRKRYNQTKPNFKKLQPDSYDRNKIINFNQSNTNILELCSGYLIQDIAATAEKILSDKMLEYLTNIKKKLPKNLNNAVYSGGLFLNVKLNEQISQKKIFKNNFFTMSPSDAGLSLGGIFSQKIKVKKKYFSNYGLSPYLGPSYNSEEIKNTLLKYDLKVTQIKKDIEKDIAYEISKGKIIGLFNGRAEHGQRSLGARSIIADPRRSTSKQIVNLKLKKRDWFMPFAPSIIDVQYNYYFKDKFPSLYMQRAQRLIKGKHLIPSAVHIDETCRVQYVDKKISPFYWKIINAFYSKTQVPMLLNTSFNRHGISTISFPRQAIEHLMEGCFDILYIEKFKVVKKNSKLIKLKRKEIISEKKFLALENEKWLNKNKNIISKKAFKTLREKLQNEL